MSKSQAYAFIFFIASLAIRLWGLNSMGNVWDEYFYYDAARNFGHNIVNKDFTADHWQANREHPPVGKYVYLPAVAWNKWRNIGDQDAYHAPRVISALIGSLTVALVFLTGARYFSLRIGMIAGLIYGLLPPVIAYHKIINLDMTMVFFFTMSMYFFLGWVKEKFVRFLWLATITGSLAIATKFNAAFIGVVFYGTVIADQFSSIKKSQNITVPLPLALFPLLALFTLFALWPWLWSNSLDHLLQTLTHWGGEIQELFWGKFGPAPLSYFIIHFLVGTPALILSFMIVGLGRIFKTKKIIGWTLLLWLVAPFLISFYHLRQDHLRYILAAYPAVALIASLGFWWLADNLFKNRAWPRTASILFISYYLLFINYKIHPYYLNYYNEFIGGPKRVAAKNLFALGFYGEGIKEATEFVNRAAADGSIVHFEIIPDDAPYLDRPRLTRYDAVKHADKGYDYLIVNANALRDEKKRVMVEAALPNLEKVYAVKAGGAEFGWVYKKTQK